MQPHSWDRIEGWWADLFGCEKGLLWQGLSVRPHALLGDYEGIFLASRDAGCHVSLPAWVDDELRESLSQQGTSRLSDPEYWRENASTSRLRVLGPSVHGYTDRDPSRQEPDEDGPPAEEAAEPDLAQLAKAVGEADWDESGFSGDVLEKFVVRDVSDEIVAAANLTDFLGQPSDVGVVVRPDRRGHGLGLRVGRAATSYAVRHCGIARWRALTTNAPSRRVAAELGFEPYCHQLAIRR